MRALLGAATIALSVASGANGAEAQRPDVAPWSANGKDLYEKCSSTNGSVAHACGEYLLGILDGVIIAMPSNAQVVCPPSNISFLQLETIYTEWAKTHPDFFDKGREMAAVAALSTAFPCRK
jgi:hypothetical protein